MLPLTTASPPSIAGGFLPPNLNLPSPSTAASSPPPHSAYTPRPLPTPHPRPLRSGSRQEAALLNYLDNAILEIGRRYVKKYLPGGYHNLDEVVEEVERVVDLVWVSGTPWLQTQYLLTLSGNFNDYISSFTPEWKNMLRLLGKLDEAFLRLVKSGEVGMTEKVRIMGIVERTRLHVVKLLELAGRTEELEDDDSGEGNTTGADETGEEEEGEEGDKEGDLEISDKIEGPDPAVEGEKVVGDRSGKVREWEKRDKDEDEEIEGEDEELEILVAKVYEKTLEELGDRLGE